MTSNLVFLFVIIFFISCSEDTTTSDTVTSERLDPSQSYQIKDISYGESEDQIFDIYLPKDRTNDTKIIVLIHGGGWTSGDKRDMNGFKDYVLREIPDVVVVNINYRLADANNKPYPMQINDITSIINFLKSNRENYVLGDEIGFVGISAGAHLALLWSYAFDTDQKTKMVCSIVGPTDFTDPNYTRDTDPVIVNLLGIYGTNLTEEYLMEISPYHQATTLSPPTILFYGGQDPLVPVTQGTLLRDRLNHLGVTNEFTLYENAGHGWIGLELLDTSIKLKTFIETYL